MENIQQIDQLSIAMALLWVPCSEDDLLKLVQLLFPANKPVWDKDSIKAILGRLQALKIAEQRAGNKFWAVVEPGRSKLYLHALNNFPSEKLRQAVFQCINASDDNICARLLRGNSLSNLLVISVIRVIVLSNAPEKMINALDQYLMSNVSSDATMAKAFDDTKLHELLPHFHKSWIDRILLYHLNQFSECADANYLAVLDWSVLQLQEPTSTLSADVRFIVIELLLIQNKSVLANSLFSNVANPQENVLKAFQHVQAGQWDQALVLYNQALLQQKKLVGTQSNLFSNRMAIFYFFTLLSKNTLEHFEIAKKFAKSQADYWNDIHRTFWIKMALFIDVRIGNPYPNEINALYWGKNTSSSLTYLYAHFMMCFWLSDRVDGLINKLKLGELKELHNSLKSVHFDYLDQLLTSAELIHQDKDPLIPVFINRLEAWKQTLQSLQMLGEHAENQQQLSRLVWHLILNNDGSIQDLICLEQKKNMRNQWAKPRSKNALKLIDQPLNSHDKRIIKALYNNQNNYYTYQTSKLPAAATLELVGHPYVVLDTNVPLNFVTVETGVPQLEVIREKKFFNVHIRPRLPWLDQPKKDMPTKPDLSQRICVIQESSNCIRIYEFQETQLQAALVLKKNLKVPVDHEKELSHALQSLHNQFQTHSDADAGEAVTQEANPLLRAEMTERSLGFKLTLVVAPIGVDGPRLYPGFGREWINARVQEEQRRAHRNLKAERNNLKQVLDILSPLGLTAPENHVSEWLIEDPELALSILEVLPLLKQVEAIDWKEGTPVRVVGMDSSKLSLTAEIDGGWFTVAGEARIDESMVIQFSQLIKMTESQKGRFIIMDNGLCLSMSERLRHQISELKFFADGKNLVHVPLLAAEWLDEVVEGSLAKQSTSIKERVQSLREAQSLSFAVPSVLQTELRPYQEDGFVWAMRLAHAGFGACLADDMGLGKTLQSLAVLLARSAGGAALIVAPTSVCGNWMSEAQRFAPTLRLYDYGQTTDRSSIVQQAGPADVVLVSYGLLQNDAEIFQGRDWHTVVADEAQIIKNAAAKRSQAMFNLKSSFRIALSGTPVENRLSELWSIMRFCNPGLLGTQSWFNQRFSVAIERDRDRQAHMRLRRLIAPFVLRRTKAMVLQELPASTELTLLIEPGAEEIAHYEALRRHAVEQSEQLLATDLVQRYRFHILTQLTRLRRAACDPRLVSPELSLAGSKIQAFAHLAEELSANGHKTLVFSQFVDFLQLLKDVLDKNNLSYQYLDGSTPAVERTRRVDEFQQGKSDFFLISLKAGGFGLNLTAADYVVITDPWWNPAVESQAMSRAHRMGQQRPVTIYRLVLKGSIEERIVTLHNLKRNLAEGLLADGDPQAIPNPEELLELMRSGSDVL